MAQFSRTQEILFNYQLMELKSFSYGKMKRLTIFGNEKRVEVEVFCSEGTTHILRLNIPPDFPESCPSMDVIAPDGILRKRDHSLLGFASPKDHLLSSQDGYTRISHNLFRNKTLLQVIENGWVWLEAYEMHLREGGSIDRFLQELATVLHAEVTVPLEL